MSHQSDKDASLVVCPKCGLSTSHQYNYCEHCGAPIEIPQPTKPCQNCGATLYAEDRFCWKCGTPAPRRPAGVAFPIVARLLLAALSLMPIIGLAYYKLWGWVSVGIGIWLLFALVLS
jgi:hypothetical protein